MVFPDSTAVWLFCLAALSDSLYALAAGTVGGLLRRRRRTLRYGSGVVYIGLGATAALVKRA